MANYLATDTDLTAVANAIRTKGGTSAQLTFPQGFVDAIAAISGGGGGETSMHKLYETTLSEPTSAVKIDLTSAMKGYDFYFLICTGAFTSSDWWYWNINTTAKTSGRYTSQQTPIRYVMMAGKTTDDSYQWGGSNGHDAFPVTLLGGNSYVSDIDYFYIQGYRQTMTVGTHIVLWGANYADLG